MLKSILKAFLKVFIAVVVIRLGIVVLGVNFVAQETTGEASSLGDFREMGLEAIDTIGRLLNR